MSPSVFMCASFCQNVVLETRAVEGTTTEVVLGTLQVLKLTEGGGNAPISWMPTAIKPEEEEEEVAE